MQIRIKRRVYILLSAFLIFFGTLFAYSYGVMNETRILRERCVQQTEVDFDLLPAPETVVFDCGTGDYVLNYRVKRGGHFEGSFRLADGFAGNSIREVVPLSFFDEWMETENMIWKKTSTDAYFRVISDESTDYRFLLKYWDEREQDIAIRLMVISDT